MRVDGNDDGGSHGDANNNDGTDGENDERW